MIQSLFMEKKYALSLRVLSIFYKFVSFVSKGYLSAPVF